MGFSYFTQCAWFLLTNGDTYMYVLINNSGDSAIQSDSIVRRSFFYWGRGVVDEIAIYNNV